MGEEAIYCQYLIKDIILPKFIAFILEENNGRFMEGNIILPLIFPEIYIKNIKYILVGGICSPTVIHFTAFFYNYQYNYFGLKKGENIIYLEIY